MFYISFCQRIFPLSLLWRHLVLVEPQEEPAGGMILSGSLCYVNYVTAAVLLYCSLSYLVIWHILTIEGFAVTNPLLPSRVILTTPGYFTDKIRDSGIEQSNLFKSHERWCQEIEPRTSDSEIHDFSAMLSGFAIARYSDHYYNHRGQTMSTHYLIALCA